MSAQLFGAAELSLAAEIHPFTESKETRLKSPRLFFMCLVAALCTSCKSIHTIEGEYRFADHPGHGLVVISTRIDNRCESTVFSSGSLDFRSTDGKTSGLFLLDNPFIDKDFQSPPGYFFVRSLPQGEYRILKLSFPGYKSKSEIGSTFTVSEGETTYLGEVFVDVPNCQRFTYRLANMWSRDEQFLKNRIRNLSTERVKKQVLR
jgi:hypothetical protein